MNTCETCRHWMDHMGCIDRDFRVCVLLNGRRHTREPKVAFETKYPLLTHQSFGCTEWEGNDKQ